MSAAETKPKVNPVLKLTLELGPLVLFFFVNARGKSFIDNYDLAGIFPEPIFLATGVFMVAMLISLAVSWVLTRHLAVMPLITGIVVLVMGGLTLWLQDDTFIKVKPTIVNVFFGAVLLIGLAFGRSLLAYVFDAAFALDAEGWRKLTWRWGLFFFVLAALNEIVWRTQTTDFWVAFKVWGIMPITMIFAMAQLPLMQRHMIDPENGRN
ncbi:MAG: septation protein A [Anderseniella sp.]|nr:septation protein A [Anderseniella sp.]